MRIRFGPFTLCGDSRQLMKNGREIHLTPKAFQLLGTLADEAAKAGDIQIESFGQPDALMKEPEVAAAFDDVERLVQAAA